MLYLKSLTLHKFKSFRHAELLFSRGFTCVVGPNGSGKSNICDALLFGLGEGSLRRLRARSLDSLITTPISKSHELRKAYIKLELDGDEAFSITRGVRSDGKSLYRVNGKRMTRQEVLEIVNKYGVHADETNTITQGEINKFNDLNPKGRRELIDIASGIEEFERKKEESLKELEKVSQKISEAQVMLDERLGFLKELEAEKAAAERYMAMSSRLKLLNYTILVTKKHEAEAMLSEYTKAMAVSDSRKNELLSRLDSSSRKIEEMNQERQRMTKELGESAKSVGEINSRLEAVKMELAKIEISSSNHSTSITENENGVKAIEGEENNSRNTIEKNSREIETLSNRIKESEARLKESKVNPQDVSADTSNVEQLNRNVNREENELTELNNRISSIKTEISSISSNLDSSFKAVEETDRELSELTERRGKATRTQREANARLSSLDSATKSLELEIRELTKKIETSDESIIRLREQRALSQQRGSATYEKIKERFGKEKGFHGRVSELCTYSSEHSFAIEAAAGGRFDYLIVDEMETANNIIKYLRENSLGRATFIPLKELLPTPEAPKEKGAEAVIDLVKFDARLRNAFGFVFNNTYLVDGPEKAQKLGIGKHRYVTMTGELIEQSGVISGGSMQKRVSIANIDREIKDANESSLSMKKSLSEKNEILANNMKEKAYAEMELKSVEKELLEIENMARKKEEQKSRVSKEAKGMKENEAKFAKEFSETEKEREKRLESLSASKERLASAYNKTVEISKHLAKYGLKKEDLERLEAMQKDLEGLKISRAEIQKENQMLEKKISELRNQSVEKKKSIEEARKAVKENERRMKELEKAKKETEVKITSDSEASKKIYGRISGLDSDIAKMTAEHNRVNNDYSGVDRQVGELKMKRSQAETRINDLTAELSVYKEAMEPAKGEIQEMEKEVIVLNAKINDLGNVNLKAPEMFDEKKRNVDEASLKVKTLDNERQAVIRMIQEIDSKKLQTFMSTLNEIAKNFSRLYNYIFTGGASIRLENPKDPFNSGLEIVVTNGKSTKVLSSMSGGEKSLLSLILIFSIHMCKPSSLYVFDEVDAALDKENSKKLSQLIKEMSKNAQFIVVSHNDSLIVNADAAIGVAKAGDESRAVGIEISSIMNRKQ